MIVGPSRHFKANEQKKTDKNSYIHFGSSTALRFTWIDLREINYFLDIRKILENYQQRIANALEICSPGVFFANPRVSYQNHITDTLLPVN